MNKYEVQLYNTYLEIAPSRALSVAVTSTTCAQLSSLVSVPLLIKAMAPERTLGVVKESWTPQLGWLEVRSEIKGD